MEVSLFVVRGNYESWLHPDPIASSLSRAESDSTTRGSHVVRVPDPGSMVHRRLGFCCRGSGNRGEIHERSQVVALLNAMGKRTKLSPL
jgi:hypothetical protein